MLRHIKPGMLVFSVLYILLGLLLLLAPRAVADVFCIALGLLVVLCGLQSLYGSCTVILRKITAASEPPSACCSACPPLRWACGHYCVPYKAP